MRFSYLWKRNGKVFTLTQKVYLKLGWICCYPVKTMYLQMLNEYFNMLGNAYLLSGGELDEMIDTGLTFVHLNAWLHAQLALLCLMF